MIQIYRLFSKSSPSFYVGSTEKSLKYRMSKHRGKSSEAPERRVYKAILANGGFKEWCIEPLEIIDSSCKMTRLTREQHWIDKLNPDLNSSSAVSLKKQKSFQPVIEDKMI